MWVRYHERKTLNVCINANSRGKYVSQQLLSSFLVQQKKTLVIFKSTVNFKQAFVISMDGQNFSLLSTKKCPAKKTTTVHS
jgi:hypothetical protein